MRVGWLSCLLILASCRKIGTQNPIREIFNIFFTLGGVALMVTSLIIYLQTADLPGWLARLLNQPPSKQLHEQLQIADSSIIKEVAQSPVIVDYFETPTQYGNKSEGLATIENGLNTKIKMTSGGI